MKEIYIIDASNFLFRAYYAIRQMTNPKGVSTNALYGFIRAIRKLEKDFSPSHVVCVYDGPNNKASRLKIYKDYKAHREGMPDDLVPQIDFTKRFCEAYGIPHIEIDGVEADDTMGAIAKWAETKGAHAYICSSDKDLCQMVGNKISILHTNKNNLIIDAKGVIEKFGVRPDQIIDYLAIMGDSSDNIPGIKGFGAKTAAELLNEFDTLENVLKYPEKQKSSKRTEKVIQETENALISQKLATLDLTVQIPNGVADYALLEGNKEELADLYNEMNFKTLLKELDVDVKVEESEKKSVKKGAWRLVTSEEELIAELKKIEKSKHVCIDTETTSTLPMQAKLIGIGFCAKIGDAFYVPLNGSLKEQTVVKLVNDFTSSKNRSFVGHNIKYDMHVLKRHGIVMTHVSFDTMIASYLLNAGANRHNLDRLVESIFDHKMISFAELVGETKKKNQKSLADIEIEKVCEYCCEDVDYTMQLRDHFIKELEERKLTKLFEEIEMPLIPILFKMEHAGIFLDTKMLSSLSKEFREKIDLLRDKIYQLAKEEFNINSPKQLSEILFTKLEIKQVGKKTKTGFSTGAEVLEALRQEHPIIELILEYRSLEKLRSTYVDSLGDQIHPETNRVHCTFNQSVTATGRLSSTNPNLQNIPIRTEDGRRIREAFRPGKKDWSFLSADYSQIELRILAHLSSDPNLCAAFRNDDDIHVYTAAQVFGVTEKEVTKQMRQQAKAVNFGLIYGQSAFGLSKELGVGMGEAAKFIEKYFAQYPAVKGFLEDCKEIAKKEGKATTMFGRERLLHEIKGTNQMLRAQAFRLAVNTPIQGTQADIMKMAMIDIDNHLLRSKSNSYSVLQIHDECIFECPNSEIEAFKTQIVDLMENTVKLDIPLKVDISVGNNWGEC